ncbi:hypothetical protein DSM106972_038500 [Dulcicalothrix desertica PCC 7102]|uniref:UNC-44 ankyrin n=1 Tax=Dulcicalothrix desertica PCC 7102 TaxID=232991 RepID=A0A3S1CDC5_9CYAN|nr:ankyrin repeat domain-containing protein [Dulcicalothrix desertica]RUT05029.1 hypothetical protein DSM106972_038500 [Dulcicalothrix desertica PCC 7102]TWH62570.1 FOG: Ankyrin repeat [Dulcicalothrix desertica PCC 7102]
MERLRSCLIKLFFASFVIFIAPIIIFAFLSKPSLYRTIPSPDGRFKLEIWIEPRFIAMPGDGGASNKSGTVYLYDKAGNELASTRFEMLMNLDLNWGLDKIKVDNANTWTLPKTNNPNILLFHAAQKGNFSDFERLLPSSNLQFRTSTGRTLIHGAVLGSNLKIIEHLLLHNIDVNVKDSEGEAALQLATDIAVKKRNTSVVELLLKYGANVNTYVKFKNEGSEQVTHKTPLLTALESQYVQLAELLLESGANINVVNRNNDTPLGLAASIADTSLMEKIIARGASINPKHPNHNLLSKVVYNFQTTLQQKQKAIDFLIGKGASLNSPVLHTARLQGDLAMVKFLISKGANVNYTDNFNDFPPIVKASADFGLLANNKPSVEEHKQVIELLLKKGADINAHDSSGRTALFEVVTRYDSKNLAVIEYLLEQKANPNIADNFQKTPLMIAASYAHHDVSPDERIKLIKLLIRYGAKVNIKDNNGKTALDLTNQP